MVRGSAGLLSREGRGSWDISHDKQKNTGERIADSERGKNLSSQSYFLHLHRNRQKDTIDKKNITAHLQQVNHSMRF